MEKKITYLGLLETLAGHPQGVDFAWKHVIDSTDRKRAGEAVKTYIEDYIGLRYSFVHSAYFFLPRSNKIPFDKSVEITKFFCHPVTTVKTYSFEE